MASIKAKRDVERQWAKVHRSAISFGVWFLCFLASLFLASLTKVTFFSGLFMSVPFGMCGLFGLHFIGELREAERLQKAASRLPKIAECATSNQV